ncbi:MAG: PIN/TRAM domain-containing protein [Desulfomonilaceae bacterium]
MPSVKATVSLCIISALFFSIAGYNFYSEWFLTGAFGALGLCVGLLSALVLGSLFRKEPLRLIAACAAGSLGALLGVLTTAIVLFTVGGPNIISIVLGYAALLLTAYCIYWGWMSFPKLVQHQRGSSDSEPTPESSLLDTSVIIDGRIADICETGFINRQLIIPQFVLKELQMIADSAEGTKRTRGRRGLDILNKMQKQCSVKIEIDDTDYPGIREVDQKLIALAKEKGYSILTNDFNLNKVAEVHSVPVLNINQLANALKPIVLPGETMKVQIIKEGKEPTQGVAYLDDGTMVVVEQGRRYMGKSIEAVVTSVLQTTAGRMIFATAKAS